MTLTLLPAPKVFVEHLPLDMVSKLFTASALQRPCQLYRDHGSARPSITQGHHLRPVYLQKRKYGRVLYGDLMWLCGTCHDNTHAWTYWLMGERKKPTPHPPLRARALAQAVIDWYESDEVVAA